LTVNSGALVAEVMDNTPASQAGIRIGDIITAVNKIAVTPNAALDSLVDDYQSGSQITLTILRDGQTLDLPVILSQLP
jgi:S1-C subfamily serine protease